MQVFKKLSPTLDPSKENYLKYEDLDYLVEHFTFLNTNRSILKIELDRFKTDLRLGLPISEKRCENLKRIITLKNTVATSTALVNEFSLVLTGSAPS